MDELMKVLNSVAPDINLESGKKLVSENVIDSLTFVMIFTAISEHYNIEIPFDEMIPENFDSVDAMLHLIEKIGKQ